MLQVNAVSSQRRTLDSIKKKWIKMKSKSKQEAATLGKKRKKTGGGETDDDDLSPLSEKVLSISNQIALKIGETGIFGIKGGLDIGNPIEPKPCSSRTLPIEARPPTPMEFDENNNEVRELLNKRNI